MRSRRASATSRGDRDRTCDLWYWRRWGSVARAANPCPRWYRAIDGEACGTCRYSGGMETGRLTEAESKEREESLTAAGIEVVTDAPSTITLLRKTTEELIADVKAWGSRSR